jgi:hypothetical protein
MAGIDRYLSPKELELICEAYKVQRDASLVQVRVRVYVGHDPTQHACRVHTCTQRRGCWAGGGGAAARQREALPREWLEGRGAAAGGVPAAAAAATASEAQQQQQ